MALRNFWPWNEYKETDRLWQRISLLEIVLNQLCKDMEEMKKAKLGSGARFKAVEESARKSGAENPAAVAAVAGRKKYGAKKMTKMAIAGKKREAKAKK